MVTSSFVGSLAAPRVAGVCCAAAALATAALQMFSAVVPPAVSDSRASYPFSPGLQIGFEIAFTVLHVLVLIGLIGVLRVRPSAANRLGRVGEWLMVGGYAIFPFAELYEASVAHLAANDSRVDLLAAFFGPGTLLFGIGAILAGISTARAGVWTGAGRYSLAASGVAMFGLVLPAQFGTNRIITDLALAVWAITLAWIGLTLRQQSRRIVDRTAAIARSPGS